MSYAIGTIIYGVVPNKKLDKVLEKIYADDWNARERMFTSVYEGTVSYWFGIELAEIDETENVDLEELLPKISSYEAGFRGELAWQEKVSQLPVEIQLALGKPKLMIVWGSS